MSEQHLENKSKPELHDLLHDLLAFKERIVEHASKRLDELAYRWPTNDRLYSAWNLCTYIAFRRRDIRSLQDALSHRGLSSLGRGEAGILRNIERVITVIASLLNVKATASVNTSRYTTIHQPLHGQELLKKRNDALFGESEDHYTRIMVTLPGGAAGDLTLIKQLVDNGMRCARINCAHDDKNSWLQMSQLLTQVREDSGKQTRIFMDLAGIKIRTVIDKKNKPGALQTDDIFHIVKDRKRHKHRELAIECSNPEVLDETKIGDKVWIDDGRLGSVIEEVNANGIKLKVTHSGINGFKLKNEKGINFPDTKLSIPALTPKDIDDIEFVVQHADLVGVSFVQSADDIERVIAKLRELNSTMAIVAKIETYQAITNLPDILLRGLAYEGPFAIMIARGDLAVELGSVRLAEIQEEILWLCEAAHVPVIWATQVLETLAKKGVISRPEITDAAMSVRAECVMLNKGKFICDAVRVLRDILDRMQAHQHKKSAKLRALHWH